MRSIVASASMSLDAELVRRKARLILEDLARLRPLAEMPQEEFAADEKNEIVTERLLERIIGRMIDINYHLLTEATGLPPKDYHESFLRLAEIGVFPREAAQVLVASAGLRNRLAHEYNGIDERLVREAADRAIRDVNDYLRAVVEWVETRRDSIGP